MNRTNAIRTWWSGRSDRERRVLLAGLALCAVIPAASEVWALRDETVAAERRLAEKRQIIATFRAQPRLLGNVRADQPLAEALRVAGVDPQQGTITPRAEGGWQLTLTAAPFDGVMTAIAQASPGTLARAQLRAVSPGRVDGVLEFAPSP